jgi:hypothetical protein
MQAGEINFLLESVYFSALSLTSQSAETGGFPGGLLWIADAPDGPN